MRLRLILSFILVALVSIISMVIIARRGATTEVRAFMYRGGMVAQQQFADSLAEYYQANGSWAGVETILGSLNASRQGRGRGTMSGMGSGMMMNQRLRLFDANGNVIADTASDQPSGQFGTAEQNQAISIQVNGNTVGYLVGQGGMGLTINDERFLLNRLTRAALIAALIACGLAVVLAFVLTDRLIKPVREMTKAARILGSGDLTQRVPVHGDDELATLGEAFNHMADSLQTAETSRRAMTADIAHELRNPLAVQRANLEALQDGIYPLNPDSLTPILDQNILLTRLVEDLRTLALAESGELKLEHTKTDLPALVERFVERFKPQADSRQVTIQLTSSPVPLISIDTMRVEQILNNLLSNALRYTPDGGSIQIAIDRTPHTVNLTIHDSGSGIPPEALPHIFERFYRVDRSRSRAEGGTGLGLAIARQLVEAHGGTLTAANHPQGGAIFTMSLPI